MPALTSAEATPCPRADAAVAMFNNCASPLVLNLLDDRANALLLAKRRATCDQMMPYRPHTARHAQRKGASRTMARRRSALTDDVMNAYPTRAPASSRAARNPPGSTSRANDQTSIIASGRGGSP